MRVGDMVYGPTPSFTYELDARAITSQLIEAGVQKDEIWKMLTLTKTSLEKGLKRLKRKELLDEFLSTVPCKGGEKIGFIKV